MKPLPVQIRKAVPSDALAAAIVNAYTWKTTYSGLLPDALLDERISSLPALAERYRADIANRDNWLVAVADKTVVGFCTFSASRNDAYPDAGELPSLYVLKGFQGAGIGKALFLAGAERLRAMGYRSMIVNCLQGNPALDFYRHMGGKVVSERRDLLGGTELKEHILYFDSLDFHS